MHSKNKPRQTAAEAAHAARVASLPCSVCDFPPTSAVHEIEQGKWWLSIALCRDCHQGDHNGLHGRRAIWKVKKMTELDALAVTIRRLMSLAFGPGT